MAAFEVVAGSGPIAVAQHAAARFASTVETRLEATLAPSRFGPVVVTTELPGSDPVALIHLDDDGVVEIGTAVHPEMVLVGKLVPRGADDLRDESLRCSPGLVGTVSAVERTANAIWVTIETLHPLAVGDTLRLGEQTGVVAEIVEMRGDVRWPGVAGVQEISRIARARDVAAARSIGPYSLVTNQPLAGKQAFGGQRVGEEELAALRARGAVHAIHELLTVKSDDVKGRTDLYISIVKGAPRVVATMPANARAVASLLRGLGFAADFDDATLACRLLDDTTIRAEMRGVVTVADSVDDAMRPIEGGLMCERIFGDTGDVNARRTREGRIELPAPVLHPWAFAHAMKELGIERDALDSVLKGQRSLAGGKPATWRDTGAHAIAAAIGDRFVFNAWPVLPPDLRPLVALDGGRFATSDLNDLYRNVVAHSLHLERLVELGAPDAALRVQHAKLQHTIDNLVDNGLRGSVTVIGDTKRPLRSLSDNLAKELERARSKRVDYSALAVAVPRAELADRVAVPRELALELWTPFVYELLEREGHVAKIKEARALVRAHDPRALAALARIAEGYPVFLVPETPATSPAPIAALPVVLWDEPAFGLPPAVHAQLGDRVVLHVPLDPAAVAEARTARPMPPARVPHGWIARLGDDAPDGLIEAALREEIDPCSDEETRDFLGLPPR